MQNLSEADTLPLIREIEPDASLAALGRYACVCPVIDSSMLESTQLKHVYAQARLTLLKHRGGRMSEEALCAFFEREDGGIFDNRHLHVVQDMTLPLNHCMST